MELEQLATAEPAAEAPPPAAAAPVLEAHAARDERERKRDEKRKRDAEAARQRRAAKKGDAPAAASSSSKPAARQEPPEPTRTDAQREHDARVFLKGFFRVVGLVASLFGFEVTPLTDAEAREDAPYLVPLARRHLFLDSLLTWAGMPVAILERLASHVRRRPPTTSAESARDAAGRLSVVPPPSERQA